MIRQPAVAGYFYQASPSRLRDQVEQYLVPGAAKVSAIGIMAPHAGLVYSGPVAGAVYSRIAVPPTIVLIGPNHTGLGAPVSLMVAGQWATPLGTVEVDEPLAQAVMRHSRRFEADMLAHLREHSLEVQLPFIQMFRENVRIVPIQMMDTRLETCIDIGGAVAKGIVDRGLMGAAGEAHRVLIVASSDMSHYISAESARAKDRLAIDRMLDLDARGLYATVRDREITMCGYGPAVAMLAACKELGATKAELVKYANSGDVSGDFEQVVGYAGVVIS